MKMYASLDECLRERLPERREAALAKAKSLGAID